MLGREREDKERGREKKQDKNKNYLAPVLIVGLCESFFFFLESASLAFQECSLQRAISSCKSKHTVVKTTKQT